MPFCFLETTRVAKYHLRGKQVNEFPNIVYPKYAYQDNKEIIGSLTFNNQY